MMYCLRCMLIAVFAWSTPLLAQGPASPVPEGRVERAQFTTAIEDREPVDRIAIVTPPVEEVFFFTDLRHLQGRTVLHRWEYEGQVISQVPFAVKGPRWRVFSKKRIERGQFGEWSVTIVDQSGWPLHTELFRYQAAKEDEFQLPDAPAASE